MYKCHLCPQKVLTIYELWLDLTWITICYEFTYKIALYTVWVGVVLGHLVSVWILMSYMTILFSKLAIYQIYQSRSSYRNKTVCRVEECSERSEMSADVCSTDSYKKSSMSAWMGNNDVMTDDIIGVTVSAVIISKLTTGCSCPRL